MVTTKKVDTGRLSDILKALREEAGDLSQYEVARRAGISATTLNRLERGEIAKPSIDDMASLAEVYGLDLNQIGALAGIWTVEEQEASGYHPLLAQTLGLLRREAAGLDPETQAELAVMVQTVIEVERARRQRLAEKAAKTTPSRLPGWVHRRVPG